MKRSKWKGPFIEKTIFNLNKDTSGIRIMSRNSDVIPLLVGKTVAVPNGAHYNKVKVTEDMIGQKFGAFSFTRKAFLYKKKLKKWDKK